MRVGFLTQCMRDRSFEDIVEWAGENEFDCLEVASFHLDLPALVKGDVAKVQDLLDANGMELSSVAPYIDPLASEEHLQTLKDSVVAAQKLGVDVVCTLGGFPFEGKTRGETIASDKFATVWKDVLALAKDNGVKIALENFFATVLAGFDTFDMVFDAVPGENFGLNYDPSHLFWQGCDYLEGVDRFKDRIFHTHAKDTEIKHHVLRNVGVLGKGWWRYVIPGLGEIDWGKYVGHLRSAGYDNVLSIEHEDGAVGLEEGLVIGLNNLGIVACA